MWKLIRKPLFTLPAESAHHLGMSVLKRPLLCGLTHHSFPLQLKKNEPNFLSALNPIGLAAGMDKNCEILESLPTFGFGFAEIGTVTPRPQGGNDKPRMFRKVETESIFNRMGFNNLGAGVVSERLKSVKPNLPSHFQVGVNLGKNKLTPDQDAWKDYASVAQSFLNEADYFVINVSSPNTPGLRALQSEEMLLPIVKAVQEAAAGSKNKKIPILVKLAPELASPEHKEGFAHLLEALKAQGIDGLVLTNTLQGDYIYRGRTMSGGWSGHCLTQKSYEALTMARGLTSLPIISVGGISNAAEAQRRFDAGASLIQIYSAWIYEGPLLIRKMIRELTSSVVVKN